MSNNGVDIFKSYMKWLKHARYNPDFTRETRVAILADIGGKATQNEGNKLSEDEISQIVETSNEYWKELPPVRNF